MNILIEFLAVFKGYLIEVLPFLMIGFLLSGLIHEFVPAKLVERHLGGKGIKPILYSTLAGTVLPICCIGSLPIALSLHQKGARLGPVLAFLVATPATSITALLVCYGLLGLKFTVFIFFAVILMGLFMGVMGNLIKFAPPKGLINPVCCRDKEPAIDPICGMDVDVNKGLKTEYQGEYYYFCSAHCQETFEKEPEKYIDFKSYIKDIKERLGSVFKYAFIDMVKKIGPEIFLGLVLAALVSTIAPVGKFVGKHFSGGLGYLFSLIFGLAMYICSTASVPLVHAFISQGMNIGAGMVLLIAGPVTSWGTLLVLRKSFGGKTLILYLTIISVLALSFGY
ncbi:MAG: YHS domain-containing protein, partial [Atribacteria sp.]|nr:YHS domain-containing protein [Candidatus Atribacteria bacterium]